MKVIIHAVDIEEGSSVKLLVKFIKKKTLPRMWTKYKYLWFASLDEFQIQKTLLLDRQIEVLYEATHDIPNCGDCEFVQEEDCYCDTRRIMMEDYD